MFTPLYDTVNAVAMRQGRWRPRLAARALDGAGPKRILDLGCGTGEMALAIARVSPTVKLIGVDGDADVLGRAAAKARAEGVEPEIISHAGFSAVTVFGRYRTGGGTLDLIEALR
jgi:ubiquinone/menaquinone biosynthesis C-methylase UbiE